MDQEALPEWEPGLIDEAIRAAEHRLEEEGSRAARRASQLAREQAYHRLAVAIDRPIGSPCSPDQLSLFPADPTLFDGPG
jgi:hypothetical protein